MHKKRGYNRQTEQEKVRDYRLFAIACEGKKTEPEYFGLFRLMSRKIQVDIIDYQETDEGSLTGVEQRSAPRWVLDKAMKYIDAEGLIDEDSLWFVFKPQKSGLNHFEPKLLS